MELNSNSVQHNHGGDVLLGEFGSMQLELYVMSQRLGISELADLADYPTRFLNHTQYKKVCYSYKTIVICLRRVFAIS